MKVMKKVQSENDWYWELSLFCQSEQLDPVSFYLFEMGASGILEREVNEEGTVFSVFFPSNLPNPSELLENSAKQNPELNALKVVQRSVEKKPLKNWQDGWREYFKPIEIGVGLLIRPPWEPSQPDRKEIVIYPGQGFGTGYHESTHLALTLLEWLLDDRPDMTVTDVGTGSGILAIAALLLKSKHVTAIDIDQNSLAEATENLVLSGVDPASITLIHSGPEALKVQSKVVMANIEDYILATLAEDLGRLTCSGGYLLLSGILTENEASLLKLFLDQFEVIKNLQMGEWSGLVLHKQG